MNAQGKTVTISAAGYSATIAEIGSNLCSLSYRGRNLILPSDPEHMRDAFRGAVLLPWPNRIDAGTYVFDGATHQLPLTEPERNNASHGLAGWLPWEIGEVEGDTATESVTASLNLRPSPGYPFSLRAEITFSVSESGLDVHVSTTNTGGNVAPYAFGAHPYLIAEDHNGAVAALDRWKLTLAADTYLATNERLIPTAELPVEGTELDFRTGKSLAGITLDHGYGGLHEDICRVDLTVTEGNQAGTGVRLTYDQMTRWIQVYTDGEHRAGVAVEPMTSPANAFRSGVDLIRLKPQETHRLRWGIQAL